jgi:flagellar motility protein MotE (MotC chaperone)
MATWKRNRFFYFFVVLQTLLLLILVVRMGFGALTLWGKQEHQASTVRQRLGVDPQRTAPAAPPAAGAVDPDWFKALQEKAAALENKRLQVEQKEKDLLRLQMEIEGKINQSNQWQAQLKKLVEEAKAVQDKKIQHLSEIFCAMPPEKAAKMVEKMDDRTVTEVFQSMRSKEVGGILSQLEPARAARLSSGLSVLAPRPN